MSIVNRFRKFFYETRVELKKVHWPTRREFAVFFGVVVTTIMVVGLFFWVIDYGLTILVDLFILR